MKKTNKKTIAPAEKNSWLPSDEALIRVLLDASRTTDATLLRPPKAA